MEFAQGNYFYNTLNSIKDNNLIQPLMNIDSNNFDSSIYNYDNMKKTFTIRIIG